VADLDDQSVISAYSKSSGAGSRINMTDEERRTQSMAGALDWLRQNSATPADVDHISVASFWTLGGTNLGVIREAGRDMADALDWFQQNDTVLGPLDGPSAISHTAKLPIEQQHHSMKKESSGHRRRLGLASG
jgi:hypothetical protein